MRQLALLSSRCTFYERHEVVDRAGHVVERFERGEPFIYRRAQGRVPIDPDAPFLDDGGAVSQTAVGYTDRQGCWHRVVLYQRHPGPPRGTLKESHERLPPLSPAQQKKILARLLQEQDGLVPVAILLRDQRPAPCLPSRAQTGLAFTELNRTDTITPRRRRLRAENQQRRAQEARPIQRWIQSVGGIVGHHATLYGSLLSARVPRQHLAALLARPEVAGVEPRVLDAESEDGITLSYLCTNAPARASDRDEPECARTSYDSSGGLVVAAAFMDAVNAATGVLDYVNAGYTGLIGGGLANWSHQPFFTHKESPTLTYGIVDGTRMEFNHPGFLKWGRSRFLFRLRADTDVDDDGDGVVEHGEDAGIDEIQVQGEDRIAGLSYVTNPEKGHATRCAAVAMANSNTGGDPALTTTDAREARSGVARQVSGLAAGNHVQIYELLDVVNSGRLGDGEDGEPLEGIDVISSSGKEGHGEKTAGDVRCASDEDARGLDYSSMHVVYAFSNDQVVFTKAGGNDHLALGSCDVPVEVSPPGASPAAISSSALDTSGMTAAEIQDVDALRSDSSRDLTLDGRSYPSLAAVSQVCGCPGTALDNVGGRDSYEHHGQTSATSPRVAGTALIFKHWYLEQYGSIANTAGQIIVNTLHFADGFNKPGVAPPYVGWGLGRLRVRLYSDAQDDTGPRWGTTSRVVWTGAAHMIDLTAGAGTLPKGVRHLRVTAWWLEVNTGFEEIKSDIRLSLTYRDGAGGWVTDQVASGSEHVLRLQYDRDDETFPCPPSGVVLLQLHGRDVPKEARSRFGPEGAMLNWRTVHVAWFWETGEDPTEIACGAVPVPKDDRCGGAAGGTEADVYAFKGPESAKLRSLRMDTEAAVRGAARIATGLAGGVGTGPVWEAWRSQLSTPAHVMSNDGHAVARR